MQGQATLLQTKMPEVFFCFFFVPVVKKGVLIGISILPSTIA